MKSILYSALVGSLALALATGGAQAAKDNNKRSQRAQPQQRSAHVQSARPATAARPASAMPATTRAHRNVSAAQNRQRRSSYANVKPRATSAVNRAPRQVSATRATAARPAVNPAAVGPATIRERNLARNERMRERNA